MYEKDFFEHAEIILLSEKDERSELTFLGKGSSNEVLRKKGVFLTSNPKLRPMGENKLSMEISLSCNYAIETWKFILCGRKKKAF